MTKTLDASERKELEELRRYKAEQSARGITRAFIQLERLVESGHDPVMSVRAFKVIADCLTALKDEVFK